MWYEILPGYAIMTACMMIPGLSTVLVHRYAFGKVSWGHGHCRPSIGEIRADRGLLYNAI